MFKRISLDYIEIALIVLCSLLLSGYSFERKTCRREAREFFKELQCTTFLNEFIELDFTFGMDFMYGFSLVRGGSGRRTRQ